MTKEDIKKRQMEILEELEKTTDPAAPTRLKQEWDDLKRQYDEIVPTDERLQETINTFERLVPDYKAFKKPVLEILNVLFDKAEKDEE